MKDDVRYSEFLFLRSLASGKPEFFCSSSPEQHQAVGLPAYLYSEMVAALIEELYVRFDDDRLQLFVSRLRGELASHVGSPGGAFANDWWNPREGIRKALSGVTSQRLLITYRGIRRIEELRDLLRRDRILEDFGVLLSIRYFRRDLEDALRRSPDVPVSVLYADMDDFGKINKQYGQAAGDVVMKAYLEAVRDYLGPLGDGYRGVGDETCALILGQAHERAVEIAEAIRKAVGAIKCEYKGKELPGVSASIGVATTPPENRTLDVETAAEDRKRQAKAKGKNCVVAG